MKSEKPLRQIQPAQIDVRDKFFRHSFQRSIEPLLKSIREVGILNPVILRRTGKKLQVVHGFSRVSAARRIRLKKIPAKVFSKKELPDREAFDLAFFDNASTRSFNLIEQAMAVSILANRIRMSEDLIVGKYLPAMNLNPGKKIFRDLLSLSKLESPWQKVLIEHGIPLKNAVMLSEMSRDHRKSLLPIIRELRPGTNKFRELIRLVMDIAAREESSMDLVFSAADMGKILSSEKLSRPQKLDAVLDILRKRRYPRLAELNKKFQQAKSRLNLPDSASLRSYPNFEEAEFMLSLNISNPEELRELAEKLKEAADDDALKEILKI